MILPSRRYEKEAPSLEARKIYIFCEGRRREYDYFNYFVGMDSRINIIVYQMREEDNTTPSGVFQKAEKFVGKIDLEDIDEVWLVFDRDIDKFDSRKPQIQEIRSVCSSRENWNIALSNPCFEVWLHYHFFNKAPDFDGLEVSSNWKTHLGVSISGGFDTRKHPLLIETALTNSKSVHSTDDFNEPLVCSTEAHLLAESIVPIVKEKLLRRLHALEA
ncbi:MAG: RloB domain-containing protein [Candidatus Sabulitectum sp.]|nr:RloB domain-containing protein [Candidatus Sabulitectum sp.]